MDAFRQYVISVTSAALICSIIMTLAQKGPSKGLINMVCGLFLVCTMIRPIPEIQIELDNSFLAETIAKGKEIADIGYQNAQETYRSIIKSELESFIYAKAESMNLEINVHVSMLDNDIYELDGVAISGTVAPYQRKQLEQYIVSELGVAKENLHWIG